MNKVRLTDKEINIISSVFKNNFLDSDHLWLFGSRVDLNKKGGDIDLYIETNIKDNEKILKTKLRFLTDLQLELEDQKIDVVIRFSEPNLPIYDIAKKEGIILV